MKVCVYGAGAIGGHVAARLLRAGHAQVSLVARGAQLQAIKNRGLTLHTAAEKFTVTVPEAQATDNSASLPPQDLVIVTLKANAQADAAPALEKLLAPEGVALFLNNGIPWWWNHGQAGKPGQSLALLDPQGALWREVLPQRVLGGVVYSSNEVLEPGLIVHRGKDNRYLLGEPDGSHSQRLKTVADLFTSSGLPAELPGDLRTEIWRKLLLNASGNPLSALTRLTNKGRVAEPELVHLAAGLVREVLAIAAQSGHDLRAEIDVDAFVIALGHLDSRPSMLQDALLQRPLEVEAILGQPHAFARQAGLLTPFLDVVLPLLRGLNKGLLAGKL